MDSTDAVTPETGVTLSGADQAELLKAGGVVTQGIHDATWAAISGCDGWYNLTLTTSHTDTTGDLTVVVQDTDVCLPVFARFQVVAENVYGSIYNSDADAGTQLDKISTVQSVTDLFTSAHAEPSGVPPANETVLNKIAWVFKSLRNKLTVTTTAMTYYDDDETAESWKKTLQDDGTTYTEGEAASP
jgi:hypothetical protein